MGALGLQWGEIAIGSNVYGGLVELDYPAPAGLRVIHQVSKSTVFPTKELGHLPLTLSGTMRLTAQHVAAFIADVRAQTDERKINFLLGSTECYVYAKSGDITSHKCVDQATPGESPRIHDVSFSFPLTRSKVYRASDDAVLWGG